jgi:hypothetical protein
VGHNQLRTWAIDGWLEELGAERASNGRWSVLIDRIPLLEEIVPRLIARSASRMRHEHLKDVGRKGAAGVAA